VNVESIEHKLCKTQFLHSFSDEYSAVAEPAVSGRLRLLRPDCLIIVDRRSAAVEFQRSSVPIDTVAERTAAYCAQDWACLWFWLPSEKLLDRLEANGAGLTAPRIPATPYVIWLHGLFHGRIFVWDFLCETVMECRLSAEWLSINSGYNAGGHRRSRRWKRLTLIKRWDQARGYFELKYRNAFSVGRYQWPAMWLCEPNYL
jgi:hypothetical protein